MADIDLDAIGWRTTRATPGPWYHWVADPRPRRHIGHSVTDPIAEVYETSEQGPNSVFIAHAREDVPALLAEVDRLRDKVSRQSEKIDELTAECDDFEGQLGDLRASLSASEAEVDRLTRELSGAELAVHAARTTEVLAQRENAIARRGWREAEAERDAMRPVVEAARKYCVALYDADEDDWGTEPYLSIGSAFVAAVDTYEHQPCPHPAAQQRDVTQLGSAYEQILCNACGQTRDGAPRGVSTDA